jgi:hypothetical protein
MRVANIHIKSFPKNTKTPPIPAVIVNKAAFLRIKKNASLQAKQKLLLVMDV